MALRSGMNGAQVHRVDRVFFYFGSSGPSIITLSSYPEKKNEDKKAHCILYVIVK